MRHQQNVAARGVAAEQRALRTLQHLDARQIEEVAGSGAITAAELALCMRRRDIGEENANRWGGIARLDEATDCKGGVLSAESPRGGERRRIGSEVLDARDVAVLELRLVEDGNGDRNVLQALLDAARGDHDLAQIITLGCAALRGRLSKAGRGQTDAQYRRGTIYWLECTKPHD